MKKLLCILCLTLLLISATGCQLSTKNYSFYYPRAEVLYGRQDGLIAREVREFPCREMDLESLMILYLEGPLSQILQSPFPNGTTLIQLEVQDENLLLTLSDAFSRLEGLDRTLACASIAKTGFGLGAFTEIIITSAGKTIILTPDTISLTDNTVVEDTP